MTEPYPTSMRTPDSTRTASARGAEHLLGEFPTYAAAEAVVDRLSDRGFPVQTVRIVGNNLRSVEYVTGRLTTRRAAGAGAASGAWFGLMVGLVIGFFSGGATWLGAVVGGLVIGAVWGGVFGALAHRASGGRRDFSSRRTYEADSYAVYVDASRADEAIRAAGLF